MSARAYKNKHTDTQIYISSSSSSSCRAGSTDIPEPLSPLLPIVHRGGARGVVVIAVGNEHGDTSSNPGRY